MFIVLISLGNIFKYPGKVLGYLETGKGARNWRKGTEKKNTPPPKQIFS